MGSIPDYVTGIFHWHDPSGCTMALGSTQPPTEISIRNTSWRVKAASALGWQLYHLHVPTILKSGSPNLLEPSGPVQACNGIALPLPLPCTHEAVTIILIKVKLCNVLVHYFYCWYIFVAKSNSAMLISGFHHSVNEIFFFFRFLQCVETCQWLKFPLNGLWAHSRVSPVVELLPLASGLLPI